MPIDLVDSGWVGEAMVDDADLMMERTGDARYRLEARSSEETLAIELWTTRKGRIDVELYSEAPRDWFEYAWSADGMLERLVARRCRVHLENLDRGVYSLILTRGPEVVGAHITSHGYLKTRVVPVQGLASEVL